MTTLTITTANPTTSGASPRLSSVPVAAVTNVPRDQRTMPLFIRSDEAYYWSRPWQEDVRDAMAALAAGDYVDFDSDDPNDVVRWLLSTDDEDDDKA